MCFGAETADQVVVSATPETEGTGSVSGAGTYDAMTTRAVTLAATPAEGYAFVRWHGLPDESLAFDETLTLPIDAYNVTAQFGPIVYASLTGTDEGDGTSWASATTVANAVAIAEDGDVVVVSNGTYTISASTFSPITISKPIALKSLTGDFNDVVFYCDTDKAYGIDISTNAVVYGITVRNAKGHGTSVHNISVKNKGAAVRCRAANGYSHQWGCLGLGIYNKNGLVVDCVIDGNYYGGGSNRHGYLSRGCARTHNALHHNE